MSQSMRASYCSTTKSPCTQRSMHKMVRHLNWQGMQQWYRNQCTTESHYPTTTSQNTHCYIDTLKRTDRHLMDNQQEHMSHSSPATGCSMTKSQSIQQNRRTMVHQCRHQCMTPVSMCRCMIGNRCSKREFRYIHCCMHMKVHRCCHQGMTSMSMCWCMTGYCGPRLQFRYSHCCMHKMVHH